MKICIDTLAMEVTRRCNMGCAHCMRGEAQRRDITHEAIDRMLANVAIINEIVFTGGEPTLNIDAIEYALEVCRKRDITVYAFYIVTNAKDISDRFLIACINWHSYIIECEGDTDVCGVAVSRDKYHEPVPAKNIERLAALSVFREKDKMVDWDRIPVKNLGRAKNLGNQEKRENFAHYVSAFMSDEDEVTIEDSTITVTVDGDILTCCDYEYADISKFRIASVFDSEWENIFKRIASDPNFRMPA